MEFSTAPRDMTPLHIAVKNHCNESLINLLSDNVSLHSRNMEGYSALHLALRLRHLDMVNLLLQASFGENPTDAWGFSHLHAAAMLDWYNVAAEMLQKGADPNQRIVEETNMELMNITEVMEQCRTRQRKNCWPIRLVSYWHSPVTDYFEYWPSYTPLHFATECQAFTTFTVLLRLGANPNLTTNAGITPLHMACALPNKVNRPYVRWLLVAEADVNARTMAGETPLHVTVYNGNIEALKVLLYCKIAFVNVDLVNFAGESCLHIIAGTSPTHQDERYRTNVKEEVKVKMIEILLEKGCRTDLRQSDNKTALQLAEENNLTLVADALRRRDGLFASKGEVQETMSYEDIIEAMKKPLDDV